MAHIVWRKISKATGLSIKNTRDFDLKYGFFNNRRDKRRIVKLVLKYRGEGYILSHMKNTPTLYQVSRMNHSS